MTVIHRVHPPIFLETEKGPGLCHFLTDYGAETDKIWTVFLENGQIYDCPNPFVRAVKNWSFYRPEPENPWRVKVGSDAQ